MQDPDRRAHDLIHKTVEQVEPPLLYGPDNKPLTKDHPLYGPALTKYRAKLQQLIDQTLQSIAPEKLRALDDLQQALRSALERTEITFHLDGKLDIPDFNLGRVKITGPIPVYKVAAGLAAAIAALQLPEWLSLRVVRGDEALNFRRNPIDGLQYVWIRPGKFQMGAVPGDSQVFAQEKPRHQVEITKGFWLSRAPVTVAAYKCFVAATNGEMPEAPEFNPNWQEEDHPIVNVNWDDAKAYCEWAGGRLPTEAEWEYGARGGKEGLQYPWGKEISSENAKYDSKGGTVRVGSYPTNGFGLYDMAGNVWEWCSDWYDEKYYAASPSHDPKGSPSGNLRVLRGGAWNGSPQYLRASFRLRLAPVAKFSFIGFRCAREVSP